MKTWAVHYDECESCHTTNYPFHGKGLCTSCYHKQYQRRKPANRRSDLESFIHDLPTILKSVGISGYAVSYNKGSVTIKKLGTSASHTWNVDS